MVLLAAAQQVVQVLAEVSLGSAVETVENAVAPVGVIVEASAETAVHPVASEGAVHPVDLGEVAHRETVKCMTQPVTAVETPVRFHSVQTEASQFIAATVSRKTTQRLSASTTALPSEVTAAETVLPTVIVTHVIHATAATQKSVCSKQNVPSVTASAKYLSVQTEKSLSTAVLVSASPRSVQRLQPLPTSRCTN